MNRKTKVSHAFKIGILNLILLSVKYCCLLCICDCSFLSVNLIAIDDHFSKKVFNKQGNKSFNLSEIVVLKWEIYSLIYL